ncbi:hypothetical protein EST38_g2615 [Candolleomyces aberdarensis]|uniref:Integrase catalytic domain-containing protein n=1 Tax=Candolleomyces aberdarensis TaxID=2316362 RepID=A0A4Q2DSL1_9AGAR|nr:hypothetical protein EST38_g2615 [Candolleomyces aberdarensis]
MSSYMNRNPTGKNQHGPLPTADDPQLQALLQRLHREQKTDSQIAETVMIELGRSTIKRWRGSLTLLKSRKVAKTTHLQLLEQAILNQMESDPSGRHGVRSIWSRLAFEENLHVPRRIVAEVMHVHAPEGFEYRAPEGRNPTRTEKFPLGPHERWSCDGHDKLNKIGCSIYGIVDDATSRYLGIWVVPSNREGTVVAYLYLSLVLSYGGIPIQNASDCGSETTQMAGLQMALRDEYSLQEHNVPAHSYVTSTHNIAVERGWRRIREHWGDNAFLRFNEGISEGLYNPDDPLQHNLSRWLWSFVFQQGLDKAVAFLNAKKMRLDRDKPGPSGISRDDAFRYPSRWGGRDDLLIQVDCDVVSAMRDEIYEEGLLSFVDSDFAMRAHNALKRLNLTLEQVTVENAWVVFTQLLPLMK